MKRPERACSLTEAPISSYTTNPECTAVCSLSNHNSSSHCLTNLSLIFGPISPDEGEANVIGPVRGARERAHRLGHGGREKPYGEDQVHQTGEVLSLFFSLIVKLPQTDQTCM